MAGECTPEEYSQANSGDEAIYCLTRGEAIGSAVRLLAHCMSRRIGPEVLFGRSG
jgi:hypothetical protein